MIKLLLELEFGLEYCYYLVQLKPQFIVKLPGWFQIDTPFGKYNPDWAIVKEGDQTLYLVRETKGTRDLLQLRTSEADKVRCGKKKYFEALDVPFDIVVSANEV